MRVFGRETHGYEVLSSMDLGGGFVVLFIDNSMGFRNWLEGSGDDRRVANLALRVWDGIVKGFDSIVLERMDIDVLVVGGGSRRISGWGFDLGILFPQFSVRVMLCVRPRSWRGAAGYHSESNTILIPVLSEGEEDLESLARLRFGAWKDNYRLQFVHEFVHYLDGRRGLKFRDIRKPDGYFLDRGEYEDREMHDYLNTPEEFNAYYQSLVAVLNKRLRPADFRVPFFSFLRRVSEMVPGFEREGRIGKNWPERLDDGYRRRFVSRLYGYYLSRKG